MEHSAMASMRKQLTTWPRRFLDWLCGGRTDYRAFRDRKRTRVYRANQTVCVQIWILAAAFLLVCSSGGCLLAIGLTATLLCFAILDPD